jgi:hypothetical protein
MVWPRKKKNKQIWKQKIYTYAWLLLAFTSKVMPLTTTLSGDDVNVALSSVCSWPSYVILVQ